jgi:hypothetical protein
MPDKPDRSSYTALDFLGFRETGTLDLSPRFQRRDIWKTPARAYFIDTLIRGYPVPPLYIRVGQSADKTRTVREVVDGQQRIRALLAYIDGDFALTKSLDKRWQGREFEELEEEHQDAIRNYPLICEVLQGVSDAKVLEIFARLNTYSVRLNAQELRNGTYFGFFKQTAYHLAHKHLEYWRNNRIVTEAGIARMLEVELTSELMILFLDGPQDKKTSIGDFYADYDDAFPKRRRVVQRFQDVVDQLDLSVGEVLPSTEFRRPPLFYSLFGAVAHRNYGLPKVELNTPERKLTPSDRRGLREAVLKLSDQIELAREDEPVPKRYSRFVNASLRQTDNIQPRLTRLKAIYRAAF